jgi:hypothetical protein
MGIAFLSFTLSSSWQCNGYDAVDGRGCLLNLADQSIAAIPINEQKLVYFQSLALETALKDAGFLSAYRKTRYEDTDGLRQTNSNEKVICDQQNFPDQEALALTSKGSRGDGNQACRRFSSVAD